MRIDQLTHLDELPEIPWLEDVDPLRTRDALFESQLLAVSVDVLRSRAALLFELRTAFHFPLEDNTAVLWASGMTECSWTAEPRDTDRTAWNVEVSDAAEIIAGPLFRLGFFPGAHLNLVARQFRFVVGSVRHLTDIPDYGEVSEEKLRARVAQWDAELHLRAGSTWPGPAPRLPSTVGY